MRGDATFGSHSTNALGALLTDYARLKKEEKQWKASYALVDKAEYLTAALNAVDHQMVVYDEDDCLVFSNESFRRSMEKLGIKLEPGTTKRVLLEQIAQTMPELTTRLEQQIWCAQQMEMFKAASAEELAVYEEENGERSRREIHRTETNHIVEVHIDTTAEKQREDKLRVILNNAAQGLAIIGEQGRIENANHAMVRLLGLEDFAFTKSSTYEEVLSFLRDKASQDGIEVDRLDKTVRASRRMFLKAREMPQMWTPRVGTHVEVAVFPLQDDKSLFCFTDMTEIVQQKEELKRETERAKAAERAKSEFLANISHEIRTPMNGVIGMAELLLSTALDDRQNMFAETIMRSGNALLTIINDILDFSKITSGQIELKSERVNLQQIVSDVINLLATRVSSKPIDLAVRIDPSLPLHFLGDEGRIRQILFNLVGNAVKFTDKGHVLIDVTSDTLFDDRDGNTQVDLKLSIKDTGIGIPENKLSSIFEKFNQADSSAARRHEGTGLGLSITEALVHHMGGTISVHSQEGVGSTFTVSIRLPLDNQTPQTTPIELGALNGKVLLVGRNEVYRSILYEQMMGWGLEIDMASNADMARSLVQSAQQRNDTYDIVMVDHQNSEAGGWQPFLDASGLGAENGTALILLTSVEHVNEHPSWEDSAMFSKLAKPVSATSLHRCLKSFLSDQDMRPSVDGLLPLTEGLRNFHTKITDNVSAFLAAKPERGSQSSNLESPDLKDPAPFPPQGAEGEKPSDFGIDVLVAEDNEVNQLVIQKSLNDLGVSYEIVANGQQAVEAYQRTRPKLILMDISMPRMNGEEACKQIRKIEHKSNLAETPIIAVTAHTLRGDRKAYLAAGMDDYLPKPISPARLQSTVLEWIIPQKTAGLRA